jgi:hypothetical protein
MREKERGEGKRERKRREKDKSHEECDGRNGAEVVSQRSLFQGLTKT